MRERTFILTMMGLNLMLIFAGGVMAWLYAARPLFKSAANAGTAQVIGGLLSTALIAGVGGALLYYLNEWVFKLVESANTEKNARLIAALFAVAAVLGGLTGLTLR